VPKGAPYANARWHRVLNQEALDAVNKHQSVADIERCAQALLRHKIRLIASVVLGIDSDGADDIRKSIRFSRTINAYQLQPAVMTPFPKTAVHAQYERENRMLASDWSAFDMMNVTFIPKR
jgi:radical SAM superfamily enzyme YgiQ (UPF0313 family)